MDTKTRTSECDEEAARNDFHALINGIYETIDDHSIWGALLTSFRRMLDATTIVVSIQSDGPVASDVFCTGRFGECIVDDVEGYVRGDPILGAFKSGTVPVGRVVDAKRIATGDDNREPIQCCPGWVGRGDSEHTSVLGILRDDGMAALLSVCTAHPLGPEEEQMLEDACPHMRRALRICREQASTKARERSFLGLLDRLAFGLILLDAKAAPVYRNAAVDAHPLIRVTEQAVQFENRLVESKRIREATLEVTRQTLSRDAPNPFSFSMRLNDSRLPTMIMVAPVNHDVSSHPQAPRAAMIISDPERAGWAFPRYLEQAHGFTKSEAEIALGLVRGFCVDEIAAQRVVSTTTVRTQIRSLMRKTGARRQMDIVRLLFAGSLMSFERGSETAPAVFPSFRAH